MWLQPWNLRKQTMEEATVLWSTNQGGLLGIKVKVMLDWDSIRKLGPMTPLPDVYKVSVVYAICGALCCRERASPNGEAAAESSDVEKRA
ncbi:hypothetical protein F2Q69_00052256 [Brassica cretica]|uniref:Uncharacterized protein n=1 Tax=Brassica cretica TaxID=69181 RepID=A0A8S9N5D0_BRACR|nr:hypothetical protein F2Q69_00052256 [Brassica cretica]